MRAQHAQNLKCEYVQESSSRTARCSPPSGEPSCETAARACSWGRWSCTRTAKPGAERTAVSLPILLAFRGSAAQQAVRLQCTHWMALLVQSTLTMSSSRMKLGNVTSASCLCLYLISFFAVIVSHLLLLCFSRSIVWQFSFSCYH